MTHIIVIICHTLYFVATYIVDFQLNTDIPSHFCILKNHLALLKDLFLKKMLLKKNIGLNNSFTLIENNLAKFESKVTVRDGLWAKATQL